VVLADDHVLVRAGIRSLLERMPSVEVVAEANDGRQALDLIAKHVPDVVLMDLAMPGLNGLDAAARVQKEFPTVKVLVLSMHANEEYVIQAVRSGASGYLLKEAAASELEVAIRAVTSGETYLGPRISKAVIERYVARTKEDAPRELTPREREIVQLVAEGKSSKEIAYLLKLSVKTIDAHRGQMMQKLDIHDVPGLVRYAMRAGLVPPEGAPGVAGY
jgi:DNA-binding NarL/FixJ family response regulator